MKVLELKFSCSTHEKVGKFRKRMNKNEATNVRVQVRCDVMHEYSVTRIKRLDRGVRRRLPSNL
jgi:hypothetical protein